MPELAQWQTVCDSSDILPMLGSRALIDGEQVAIFRVKDDLYAVSAIDPFTHTAVMARGIVGSLNGELVVASPLYKQHFSLVTGLCLEDPAYSLTTYRVREQDGKVQIAGKAAKQVA